MEFKIGDLVRRINDSFGDVLVGDIKEIVAINATGGLSLKGDEFWTYSPENFELVDVEEKLADVERTVYYYDVSGDRLKLYLTPWKGQLDLVSYYSGQPTLISFDNSKDVLDLAHDLLRMGLEMKRGGF